MLRSATGSRQEAREIRKEDIVNQRFDRLESEMRSDTAAMNTRIDRREAELTGKIDLILHHVIGQADREYSIATTDRLSSSTIAIESKLIFAGGFGRVRSQFLEFIDEF